MQDMLHRLGNDDEPMTTVYFSHSAALQLFLTALGALRDEIHLTAEQFGTISTTRKWKTSEISPFAGNIGIVRYKCPINDRVKFFLNENLLTMDWCNENGSCDWHKAEKQYQFYANQNCNNTFCQNEV